MKKTQIIILILWILSLLFLLVIPKEAYGYDFDDLKRELQDASIDCRNLSAGMLHNGYVYVYQSCTHVGTNTVTTTNKTLIIDFEGLRWKRFIGLKFQ